MLLEDILANILIEMKGLDDYDPEASHRKADALLIEALEVMAGDNPFVSLIVEAWYDATRWYA